MAPSPTDTPARATSPDKEEIAGKVEPSSTTDPGASQDGAEVKSVASEGEVGESDTAKIEDAPPLPEESVPAGPPPAQQDDGWDCQWDSTSQNWFFYNRFTGQSQWDNPRISVAEAATVPAAPGTEAAVPLPPSDEKPAAGGYNPAIHGDYDPNAWYAQADGANSADYDGLSAADRAAALVDPYAASAGFNRFTGQFQAGDAGPERHTDEAKSRRQMNAFFDVDAAANSHDGRSLKAERSNKKPSKSELKAFKEKRRVRKEEKRRAWLRD